MTGDGTPVDENSVKFLRWKVTGEVLMGVVGHKKGKKRLLLLKAEQVQRWNHRWTPGFDTLI